MRNPEAGQQRSGSRRTVTGKPLGLELSPRAVAELLSAKNVLAVVSFDENTSTADPRHIRVPLPILHGAAVHEVWTSDLPVQHGNIDGIGYACNDEVVIAQLTVTERNPNRLEAESYDAYIRIRRFLESQGYPYPARLWNYFPEINEGNGDEERYKQFCLGRARAIHGSPDFEQRLPAASAIGSGVPGFEIYMIAARHIGIQIENPRQVSAFHYPRQYGPKSPSFSRARLIRWQDQHHLYLSGTSSVVGHETLHENDSAGQLTETLLNIDALLEQASEADPSAHLGWQHLKALRVYLRDSAELAIAQKQIFARLGANAPVVYLRGDICRRDLNVEIEGVFIAGANR
nr:hypothetical protein Hi04_10k_c5801_00002 [uncultured bacterium]